MRRAKGAAVYLTLAAIAAPARAEERFFVYNQTERTTFAGVAMAPVGTGSYGPNQALNDRDKTLEPGERLKLTGVSHGRYDVRLTEAGGHVCVKHDVDLTTETAFEIRESDRAACR